MSEREELQEMVSDLGKRLSKTEKRSFHVERSNEDLCEQVAALRKQYGLPADSPSERLERRGVPAIFRPRLLSGRWDSTKALDCVRELVEGKGLLLVLSGKAGCGKSFAAAWALMQRPGIWVHVPHLAEVNKEQEVPLDVRMRTCGLLVLDDVGIEHSPGGYAAARIANAVVYREEMQRPTILTTNLSGDDFAKSYGDDRMRSRLDGDQLGWQTVGGFDLRAARPHWAEALDR